MAAPLIRLIRTRLAASRRGSPPSPPGSAPAPSAHARPRAAPRPARHPLRPLLRRLVCQTTSPGSSASWAGGGRLRVAVAVSPDRPGVRGAHRRRAADGAVVAPALPDAGRRCLRPAAAFPACGIAGARPRAGPDTSGPDAAGPDRAGPDTSGPSRPPRRRSLERRGDRPIRGARGARRPRARPLGLRGPRRAASRHDLIVPVS